MDVKEATEEVESVFDCHENDRACSEEDRINIRKDKDGIIELLQRGEKYPEIEKIFIDFDVYIHHIEIGEELRKVNPLQGKYIDGYKQCYEDIRNRIRELIKSN